MEMESDNIDKRTLLAGLAMQVLIDSICNDVSKVESCLRDCNEKGYKSIHEWIANTSIDYADALLERLNKEDKE